MFVSSTFRDMQAEREELVKRVFPELRRRCEHRDVSWSEVDLRWGVTDEAKAEGEVLPICLREIELSRPYFIGIVGQRYGWVPDEIPADLAVRYGWLDDDRGRSVTELEILHGVLNDPAMAGHAFFYLRDAAWATSLPEAERATYVDDDPVQQQRLAALRDRLQSSPFPVRSYGEPRAVGDLVLADLGALIDELFPADAEVDAHGRDEASHRRFAASRFAGAVARPSLIAAIDAAAASGPVVVTGPEGAGKSTLLSAWADGHPGAFVHFVGATADSVEWPALVRRLLGGSAGEYVDDLELAKRVPAALATMEAGTTVTLDGLDQIQTDDRLPLFWLPEVIPANVRLVVSAGEGPALVELRRRGWAEVAVPPLAADERRAVIQTFLARWAKALDAHHVERLATAAQTGNALFVHTVLDELRQWGDHFTLGERIDAYLATPDLDDLFAIVLARYEGDFDRDRPHLTADAMRLLWAGHRGVTEAELLDALGGDGAPLPRASWSPLFLAAETNLLSHDGRLTFAHGALRRAVHQRYLPTVADQRTAHASLAGLFDSLTPRAVEELPHQLAAADRWDDLAEWLSRPDVFDATYRRSLPDLHALWTRLEAASPHRAVAVYGGLAHDPALGFQVSVFLAARGYLPEAIAATGAAITAARADGSRRTLLGLLLNRAAWQLQVADLAEAEASYAEARHLAVAEGDRALEQSAIGGLAMVRRGIRDADGAVALLREMASIASERGDLEGLEMAAANEGSILLDRSDFAGAIERYAEAERLARQDGDPLLLRQVSSAQATVLAAQGKHDEAAAQHATIAGAAREAGDRYWVSVALGNQAVELMALGRIDEARAAIAESTALARTIGDMTGLARGLLMQATLAHRVGDVASALALLDEHAEVCAALEDDAGLANGLGERATIMREHGDLDIAAQLHAEEQRLHERAGCMTGVATSIGNQALVALARGDVGRALTLMSDQERRCREVGWIEGLVTALGNHSSILLQTGRLDDADGCLRELESLHRTHGNAVGVGAALQNRALVAHSRGDFAAALALTEEQLGFSQQGGDGMSVLQGTANRGELLCRLGRVPEGLAALDQAEQWARQNGLLPLAQQIAAVAAPYRAPAD